MKKKIRSVLIIGGSSFIGTHLSLALRDYYKVFSTYYKHKIRIPGVTTIPFNVENKHWSKIIIYTIRPDIVIYCAGKHDFHWADLYPFEAEKIHTLGPTTVANTTDILQPFFILLSSAYVFDGQKGNYKETDMTLPIHVLGRLKMAAENIIKSKSLNYVIIRSSPLFGRGNGLNFSFLDKIRLSLDKKEKLMLDHIRIHSFGYVEGLCQMIERVITSGLKNRIIHYSGLTKMTEYDFARLFAKRFSYPTHYFIPVTESIKNHLGNEGTGEDKEDYSLNSTISSDLLKMQPLLLEESFDLIEKRLIF